MKTHPNNYLNENSFEQNKNNLHTLLVCELTRNENPDSPRKDWKHIAIDTVPVLKDQKLCLKDEKIKLIRNYVLLSRNTKIMPVKAFDFIIKMFLSHEKKPHSVFSFIYNLSYLENMSNFIILVIFSIFLVNHGHSFELNHKLDDLFRIYEQVSFSTTNFKV
ncbi:hypothetical protein BpHYR1_034909 [Brachionus plicatilis]|uniref:Uncharacterized protein n=1 Tax=Brachionus plicatilis TaxID=10195 RepID=A0A3M7RYA6_BRAPC|nr:hypothetical protein BpHYR1_034909 [Brachionus plicatilis]